MSDVSVQATSRLTINSRESKKETRGWGLVCGVEWGWGEWGELDRGGGGGYAGLKTYDEY